MAIVCVTTPGVGTVATTLTLPVWKRPPTVPSFSTVVAPQFPCVIGSATLADDVLAESVTLPQTDGVGGAPVGCARASATIRPRATTAPIRYLTIYKALPCVTRRSAPNR